MYKDKEKERSNRRDNMKRYRERKAITGTLRDKLRFIDAETGKEITGVEVTQYPDIIDKLTDPFWRDRLEKICSSFSRRSDIEVCWLGDTNLSTVCDYLRCTG